ncbi:MAG: methylmalonyl-CoA mutase, partial [Polaribacter sp.]|nr:methylmalonyl-CoA mutase [Polaribacter sp.]
MSTFLFDEFEPISAAAWKQKIQVDLKGEDYNKTLLWKTDEGIIVKPFYTKEDRTNTQINLPEKGFNICQTIFIDNEKIANSLALDALKRGANAIQFKASKKFDYHKVLNNVNLNSTTTYFQFTFLDADFQIELSNFCNSKNSFFQTDIIGNLAESGNWFVSLKGDYKKLETIVHSAENCISVSGDLYQNAGATITQQLAYTLAHANEYLNYFGK